jgi:pimeloyl-ACP methyl ester carboxylesterase
VSLTEVAWGRRLLLAMTAADGAGLPPALARQMVEASSTALRTEAALATITSSDLRPVLASLTTPLGVIWGEADRTVPLRILDEVTNARPDARVVRLPGAGHVPMVEQPQEFADALQLILRELW